MEVKLAVHVHTPGGEIMGISCGTPGIELDVMIVDQNLEIVGRAVPGEQQDISLAEASARMEERATTSGFVAQNEAPSLKSALRNMLTQTLN